MTTCDRLRGLIKAQLGDDLRDVFDVGYYHNKSVVSIRSADDLREVWAGICKSERLVLWCDGLTMWGTSSKSSKRSKSVEESDSEVEQVSKQ